MKAALKIGDIVSAARWDATEPPAKRFGEGVVIKVTNGARSESGTIIDVRNAAGKVLCGMDLAWFRLCDAAKETQE